MSTHLSMPASLPARRFSPALVPVCSAILLLAGCSAKPIEKSSPPAELTTAVRLLAQSLAAQLNAHSGKISFLNSGGDHGGFIIDPFIEADTGNVTHASLQIQDLLGSTLTQNQITVLPFDPASVAAASDVILGSVAYEPYGSTATRHYHLFASVVDVKTSTVIANADAWVSNNKIDISPVDIYQSSPMYIKDNPTKLRVSTSREAAGSPVERDYVSGLDAAALSQQASAEFDKKDYEAAIADFNRSIALPQGKTMKNYSGLYQSYYKLGQRDAATKAFYDLFNIAAGTNDITLKFLFSVNSVDFIADQGTVDQYGIWLQQAAQYFDKNGSCLTVVGHSSHTGEQAYNVKLSLARAEKIQKLLASDNSAIVKKIQSSGRGFSENIVGTGTDDLQDAIDRRVEFKIRPCS